MGRLSYPPGHIIMEYIDGHPLTKYCDSRQLSITDRLKLFRKICDAVSNAHQNLIVDRDLKPDNILVTADGTPKLLDFGVPADGSEPTMTMVRMGTPAYSSPEQIRGEPVGVATDVYSLGVILYELLTENGHTGWIRSDGKNRRVAAAQNRSRADVTNILVSSDVRPPRGTR